MQEALKNLKVLQGVWATKTKHGLRYYIVKLEIREETNFYRSYKIIPRTKKMGHIKICIDAVNKGTFGMKISTNKDTDVKIKIFCYIV